jgi:hypothetical protein
MLNIVFPIHAMSKALFFKGLNEDVYYKNISKFELKALM